MIKKILVVLVGIALFIFVLSKVDVAAVWVLLRQADWKLCLLSLGTLLVMVYLKGVRWSYLLKMQGHAYSVWNCFLIYMGTLFWGNVTPGRAGDFMKILYLKEDLKLSVGTGMTSVLVDRVFDLYLLLILGSLGILIYPLSLDPRLVHLVWVFFALLVVVTVLAFNKKIGEVLIKAVFQKVLGAKMKEKANQAFEDFHRGMESFYSPAILVPVFLSLVSYLIFFWGCSLLAVSIGLQINIFFLAFTLSVVNIVSLLTFLGMGTREGALILLFGLIGFSREQALAYSLLLLFVGTILFSLIALFCYFLKPVPLKQAA
jgi:uncharacterized protein (TIRG00374 family)